MDQELYDIFILNDTDTESISSSNTTVKINLDNEI